MRSAGIHPVLRDASNGSRTKSAITDGEVAAARLTVSSMHVSFKTGICILASRRYGTLYVGVTGNFVRRVAQHKASAIPGFTGRYDVTRLVYHEVFGDIYDAIVREKRLKHWKRLWKVRMIERLNPDWRDLFPEFEGMDVGLDEGLGPLSRSSPIHSGIHERPR